MTRRRHYGFERRRREDAQRAKQEAKRLRRQDREQKGVVGPEVGDAQDSRPQAGLWEWFSPSRSRIVTSEPGARPGGDPPDDWVLLTDVSEEPEASAESGPPAET